MAPRTPPSSATTPAYRAEDGGHQRGVDERPADDDVDVPEAVAQRRDEAGGRQRHEGERGHEWAGDQAEEEQQEAGDGAEPEPLELLTAFGGRHAPPDHQRRQRGRDGRERHDELDDPAAGEVVQSAPTGLTTPAGRRAGDQLPYGVSAQATVTSTTASTASARAGRHRRDGSLPSGSSSGTTVATVTRAGGPGPVGEPEGGNGEKAGPAAAQDVDAVLERGRRRRQDGSDGGEEPPDGQPGAHSRQPEPGPPESHSADDRHHPPVGDSGASGFPAFATCRARLVASAPATTRTPTATAASTRRVAARGVRGIAAAPSGGHDPMVGRAAHSVTGHLVPTAGTPRPAGSDRARALGTRSGRTLASRAGNLPAGPDTAGRLTMSGSMRSTTVPTTAGLEHVRRGRPSVPAVIVAAGLQMLVATVTTSRSSTSASSMPPSPRWPPGSPWSPCTGPPTRSAWPARSACCGAARWAARS